MMAKQPKMRLQSVLEIRALFYSYHDLSMSQSLFQCSSGVLKIQALFYDHHDLSVSQSLLQCSSGVLKI